MNLSALGRHYEILSYSLDTHPFTQAPSETGYLKMLALLVVRLAWTVGIFAQDLLSLC